MEEADAAMSTGLSVDSTQQATTSMGTDQSSSNDTQVDRWENEGGTYSPLPAEGAIAEDVRRRRYVPSVQRI